MLFKVIIQKPHPRKADPSRHQRVVLVEAASIKAAQDYIIMSTEYLKGTEGIARTEPVPGRTFLVMP